MKYTYANLTPSEYCRMNDIEDDNIITWAHSYETHGDIEDEIIARVEEARGQYPAEDCLSDIIEQVKQLNVRGENQRIKATVLSMLENTQTSLYQAAEQGMSELDKLMGVLNHG
jgi:hypothetical protein